MLIANIPFLPDRAAEHAAAVDYLFYYISAVCLFGGGLVAVLMLYFCSRYRRRGPDDQTPRIYGSHKLELAWTVIPTVLFLTFFAWGVVVYNQAFEGPADAPEIYVTGKQWMWKVQHARTGVRENNELHLLVNQPVRLTLISEDVIHSFGIPAFRDKIDVLPGRYVSTWYTPTKVGRYPLFCQQLCGIGHSQMIGWVHVMEKSEYDAWMEGRKEQRNRELAPFYGPTDGSLAWEGRKLFLKLGCITCHNREKPMAPLLEGVWGRTVPLDNGNDQVVNEGYVRESVLHPKEKVHRGWKPIMPTFEGLLADKSLGLSQEDTMIRLIAFIKTLGPGQTPDRTESYWAPVGAPTELGKKKDTLDPKGGKNGENGKNGDEGKKGAEGKKDAKNPAAGKTEGGSKKP